MGRYVNNNKVNLNAEGGSYDYDDAVKEIADLVRVGARSDGKYYLADVLSAAKINKWALHKPIKSSNTNNIANSDLMSAKCGLTPVKVTKLLAASNPLHIYTKDVCLAEIAEWGYNKPRGVKANEYEEWFRIRDMHLYNHIAEAPDNDWGQMDISLELLNKLKEVQVTETITGDYGKAYNFKLDPKYNNASYYGGLYDNFSMKLGTGTGEIIGGNSNMEIPIEYVASLDGAWRITLAVWIPQFNVNLGNYWVFFSSRMTIEQYFKEYSGTTEQRQIFPDLATNPYGCQKIAEYLATTGSYATFDVVPLLVKNLGNEKEDGVFNLVAVGSGVTEAYCMPSGANAVPFVIGTPPMTLYYKISRTYESGAIKIFLENTDTSNSHTFGYELTRIVNGSKTTTTGSVTLSAGEKRQISAVANASGNGIDLKVTSQDGVAIN